MEKIRQQLSVLSNEKGMSLEFISAVAGDRPLTPKETRRFKKLYKKRGPLLFVDLLLFLTHQYYPAEKAEDLWHRILEHKGNLAAKLGRNPGITVATLDYLGNMSREIGSPTVISEQKIAQIAEIAIKDGLTGLFDASTFYTKMEVEIKRYKRYGSCFSLLMIDIDDFKAFNDNKGHVAGDAVLAEVASLIIKVTRDLDVCARYGGEKFSVILPQTDEKVTLKIAERIRRQIEKKYKSVSGLTVSIGCAMCPKDGTSAKVLVKNADRALYSSKAHGKNLVTAS